MNPISTSYEKQLEICSSLMERAVLLNKYAWEMCRLDTLKSMELSNKAFELSEQINYKNGKIDANLTMVQCFWLTGDYVQAIDKLDKLMPVLNETDYQKARAEALNLFGSIYSSMNKLSEAENYFKQTLELRKLTGDSEGIVRSMNSLGDTLMKNFRYDDALEMFKSAQKIDHSNETYKGIVLYNIAEASFFLNRFEESYESIARCLKIGEKLNFPLMTIYCKSLLAKIKIIEEKFHEAETFLLESLILAEEIQNNERSCQILSDLSKVNELTGNIPQAFTYFKKYQKLKENILTQESNERLKALEHRAELETARKETELEKIRNSALLDANIKIAAVKDVLASRNREITDSIRYAKRIQEAMLPSEEFIKTLFPDSFLVFRPKDLLSGDFYWVSEVRTKYDEKFVMASVVDCTGHGVPGALMSLIGNNFLRICEYEPTVNRPSEALDFINVGVSSTLRQEYSKSVIRDGMDMVFVAIDYAKMTLYFAGAKNPIYLVRNNELMEFKGDKHPIGAFVGEEMIKFTNHTIPIQTGDCLYLFTDGFADQFGGSKGKKFMYKRFKELLLTNNHLPMKRQEEILLDTFEEWKGDLEQVDDVCIIGFRL